MGTERDPFGLGLFKVSSPDESTELEIQMPATVTAVAVDRQRKVVWAYAAPRLHTFDFDGSPIFDVAVPSSGTPADLVVRPSDGSVWLSLGTKLHSFSASGAPLSTKTVSKAVLRLRMTESSTLWVATSSRVSAHDPITGSEIGALADLGSAPKVKDVSAFGATLWVGLLNSVRQYSVSPSGAATFVRQFSISDVLLIDQGSPETLWVATVGAFKYIDLSSGSIFTVLYNPFWSNETAISLAADADGSLWAAGSEGTFSHVDHSNMQFGYYALPIDVDLFPRETVRPTISFLSPAEDAWVAPNPQVRVAYSDVGSGVDTARLSVSNATCVPGPMEAVCDVISSLPEGTATLSAYIHDRADNTSSASRQVRVDATPPALALNAPASGSSLAESRPEIRVSYSDSGSGVDLGTLSFTANGAPLAASCSVGPADSTCTPQQDLPRGSVTLAASLRDIAGNFATQSVSLTITVGRPSLAFEIPKSGAVVTGLRPPLRLAYGDPDYAIDTTSLLVSRSGQPVPLTCSWTSVRVMCVPTSDLEPGETTLVATVRNAIGEVSAPASVTFTVVAPAATTVAGTVELESGAPGVGAEVWVVGQESRRAVAGSDGGFTISGVDASAGTPLSLATRLGSGENALVGSVAGVAPQPDGVTQAGTIVVRPLCPKVFSDQFGGANALSGDGNAQVYVDAFAVFDDGTGPALYVAGNFRYAGGVTVYNIAKWNGTSWEPLGTGFYSSVTAMAVFDDGTGPALYVSGYFTYSGNTPLNHIAKWDGSQWSEVGGGLDKAARALLTFDDGYGPALYAAGNFRIAGGAPARGIARWNGFAWEPLGQGVEGEVYALAVFDDGSGPGLFVGGSLTLAGGVPTSSLAKWQGGAWSSVGVFEGPWAGVAVHALTVLDLGDGEALYVGGEFLAVSGTAAAKVARWDGAAWSGVWGTFDINDDVYALAGYDDGSGPALIVGGSFAGSLRRWDGGVWTGVGGGMGDGYRPDVTSLLVTASPAAPFPPTLVIGGDFESAGGWNSPGLVFWQRDCTPPDRVPPVIRLTSPPLSSATSTSSVTFTGSLSETASLTLNGAAVTVAPDLSFSHGPVALASGLNVFDLVARDASANQTIVRVQVVRDSTPPSLAFVLPKAGSTVNSATPLLELSHQDAVGVAAGTLSISRGGTPVATTCTSTHEKSSCNPLAPLPNGAVTLAATIRDLAGNISPTAQVTFTVNLSAPQPQTTVTGQVQFVGGAAAVGASVSVLGHAGATAFAGADGRFSIPGVALRPAETLTIVARLGSGRDSLLASRGAIVPVESGITDAGVLILRPLCAQGFDASFLTGVGLDAVYPEKDPSYNDNYIEPQVRAMVVWDDGSGPALYVGGTFLQAGGVPARHIAKWDGTRWSALGTAVHGGGVNADVRALAVWNGALYVGGAFGSANGVAARRLAKWDGATWSEVGGGVGSGTSVYALSVFNNALYVGGSFTQAGPIGAGISANRIAKWDGSAWSALGSGTSEPVYALAVYKNSLYVGGSFEQAGGATAYRIAKWSGSSWSTVGGGVGPVTGDYAYTLGVYALAVHAGDLYVGGDLDSTGPETVTGYGGVARWNGQKWSKVGSGLWRTGVTVADAQGIQALASFDDGTGPALYALGSIYFPNTEPKWQMIAKWNGATWSSLAGGLTFGKSYGGAALAVFDPNPNDQVPPRLYVGNASSLTNGGLPTNSISAWDGTSWHALDLGVAEVVTALTVHGSGSGSALYVAPAYRNLLRWDGSSWASLPGLKLNLAHAWGGLVRTLASLDVGLGPRLYAGGDFLWAGPWQANRVATWNGTSWEPLGAGFDDGEVRAFAVFDDGTGPALYAAGSFTKSAGQTVNHVARWDGAAWRPLGTGLTEGSDQGVWALAVYDDGTGAALYAGGYFLAAGGDPIPYIARWDGRSWHSVGPGVDDIVWDLLVANTGDGPQLYASGFFSSAGGQPAKSIACWDGQSWAGLGNEQGSMDVLAAFDDGTGTALYVGGNFSSVGGQTAKKIAKWVGQSWSPVGSDIDVRLLGAQGLTALASFPVPGGPALYVGGSFAHGPYGMSAYYGYQSDGGEANYLARLHRPLECSLDDSQPPTIAVTAPTTNSAVNNQQPTILVSYSDDRSGVDTTTLAFKAGGLPLTTNCDRGPSSASCAPASPFAESSVSLEATIKDAAGNLSAPASVTFVVDVTPPSLSFMYPPANSATTPRPNATLAFSDAGSGVVPTTLLIEADGLSIGFTCALGTGTASCTPDTPLPSGPATLRATIRDRAGNVSTEATLPIRVEATRPVIQFTAPAAGATVATRLPELRLTYGDGDGNLELATLAIFKDGAALSTSCTKGPSDAVCTPVTPLPSGAVTLEATIRDTAGNLSEPAQVSFTVDPGAAPQITLSYPADGAITTSSAEMFIGSVSEPATLTLNGSPVSLDAQNRFNHGPVPLAEGPNRFTLRAVDAAANSTELTVFLIRDTSPPTLVFLEPREGQYHDPPRPFELPFGDNGSGVDPFSLTLTTEAGQLAAECTLCAPNATCRPLLPLSGTVITVTATIRDRAGNVSAPAQVRFTTDPNVDITAPVIQLAVPQNGAVVRQPRQFFRGTVSEPATLTLNGSPVTLAADNSFNHGPVSLVEGANPFELVATDVASNVGRLNLTVTLDSIAPPAVDEALVTVSGSVGGMVSVSGAPGAVNPVEAGLKVVVANLLTTRSVATTPAGDGSFSVSLAAQNGEEISVAVRDAAGNVSPARLFVVPGAPQLPPDPAAVAPALDSTVATDLCGAVAFLHTGSVASQIGVEPGAIDCTRVAVLRGRVLARDGTPVSAVSIRIVGAPELGSTLTRADGGFELVLNGGGVVTVGYAKRGFLTAHRKAEVSWKSFATLPDVVLVAEDVLATEINLAAPTPIQVARGSVAVDSDGSRQATLFFAQGTTAQAALGDGGGAPMSVLHVRATEYTIGATGPEAMPAPLPATSGYTYAVELSVDEGRALGAGTVEFSQPVISYTENFLSFPVGTRIPAGYYDRAKAAWLASEDGRVIKILGVTAGLADLDVSGSGQAADAAALAVLGISDAERQQLATLYGPGQSLWRARLEHFSPYDYNFPLRPPVGAESPKQPEPKGGDQEKKDDSCLTGGSIIECENQILGEVVGLAGMPFTLHYQSDRVPGRRVARTLEIPLTGATLPPGVERVEVGVSIAGQDVQQSLAPGASQSYGFTWDGKDGYGRSLQGRQPFTARVGYVYRGSYAEPAPGPEPSFGLPGGSPISSDPARSEVTLWQEHAGRMGAWDALAEVGLGGWTLSAHHTYDPHDRSLYLGDGRRREIQDARVITTVVGTGEAGFGGDGGPAADARVDGPASLALSVDLSGAPDGGFYFTDNNNCRIRHVAPSGTVTTVAGQGCVPDGPPLGDGGPATQATLDEPQQIAVGPDGSLYIADQGHFSIRRVDPGGTITTVAGYDWFHDNPPGSTPATRFQFGHGPKGLAVDRDGNLYVALDSSFFTGLIYRFPADGGGPALYAGGGAVASSPAWGDGGFATDAWFLDASRLTLGPEGSLYFADTIAESVWRVTPEGILQKFAGRCLSASEGCLGYAGDGGPARQALLDTPGEIRVAASGSVLVSDYGNHALRRIDSRGIISTVAGTGISGFNGSGRPATQTQLSGPVGLAVLPDGAVLIGEDQNQRIRRMEDIFPPEPPSVNQVILIPSEDGAATYVFDSDGRHLRTEDAHTGQVLLTFGYDARGYLISITDAFGNATTIERDASHNAQAIVGPFGQRSELGPGAYGYLGSVTNPAGERVEFTYTPDGLLTGMTDPKLRRYTYGYDSQGRLIRDEDPLMGYTELARTEPAPGSGVESVYTVTKNTALGRVTNYTTERLATGETRTTVTDPAGLSSVSVIGTDGARTLTSADGTVATSTEGPDPRFGMQQPLAQSVSVRTPSGLTSSTTASRSVTFVNPQGDPRDPQNLATITDSVTVNGRTALSLYSRAGNQITTTSPEGRQGVTRFDVFGRVIGVQAPGIIEGTSGYDTRGRLQTVTQGSRTTTYSYNPEGYVQKITDPLARDVQFTYDLAGRVKTQTLSDGRVIGFDYDVNGNLTSITPPGRPAHAFDHTAVDQVREYNPPDVGLQSDVTTFSYNLDRQLELMTRPDGQTVDYVYGAATGRLGSVVTPRGAYSYSYDATSGHLTSVADPDAGAITYSYDGSLPTAVTWSGAVSGSIGLTYNNSFELTRRTVNGSNAVDFAYDRDGLLAQAGSLALSRDTTTGFLTGTTLATTTDAYTYTPFGELDIYTASHGASTLYSVDYTRDAGGRLTRKVEMVGGVSATYDYRYDLAGRLDEVKKNDVVVATYAYDTNSNRTSWTDGWGSGTATYDAQDRLLTYADKTFTYTTNGELLTKTQGGQTVSYSYDVFGNLRSVTLPDGIQIEYLIDAANRRIGKKVNGTLVKGWLYKDQLFPVAELDDTGNVVSLFVYGSKANVPDYMVRGGTTYRIISDHLGSVRLVVSTTDGSFVQRLDYDAFGRVQLDTTPGFQPFGFAGGLYDHQTGLVRFGARDFDPETGRWTSKDPIGFAGGDANLYGYVLNDPVNLIDPNGNVPPLLLALWGVVETGLSILDALDTIKTLLDPCESGTMKALTVGGALLGAVLPGGGYGAGARRIAALSDDVARTFRGRRYVERVLEQDLVVYRAEGNRFGRWYGLVEPANATEADQMYTVIDYGNDVLEVSTYRVPAGTMVYQGAVAGGTGVQIYIPDPRTAGVQLLGTKPLSHVGF